MPHYFSHLVFFFNDTATTEIYTLSLHDALPILSLDHLNLGDLVAGQRRYLIALESHTIDNEEERHLRHARGRSEEHTSELQSLTNLVCRLLLEKKKRMSLTCIDLSRLLSSLCLR